MRTEALHFGEQTFLNVGKYVNKMISDKVTIMKEL